MIKEIEIKNFLSHKRTSLQFSEGVNIIVGPTDSGKSAIIKALKWVISNRPLGDSVRSYWGGRTMVIARFNEGEVIRLRADKDNAYEVVQEGKSVKFSAIKGEVPQEVAQMLDLSDVNIQPQFAPHFLLSQSSGEVAQYFNKVAHLDKIDTASQNIRRWLKEVQQKITFKEEALKELKTQFEQYSDLDEIKDRLTEIEGIEEKCDSLINKIEELQDLSVSLEKVLETLNGYSFLLDFEGAVQNILTISDELKQAENKESELSEIVSSLKINSNKLISLDKERIDLENKFHEELDKGSICPLCESIIN